MVDPHPCISGRHEEKGELILGWNNFVLTYSGIMVDVVALICDKSPPTGLMVEWDKLQV